MATNNCFRLDDDEYLFPAPPGSRQDKSEEAVQLLEFWLPLSPIQNGRLLSERENKDPRHHVEPSENDQSEKLYDHHHEQHLHAGSVELRNSKIQ